MPDDDFEAKRKLMKLIKKRFARYPFLKTYYPKRKIDGMTANEIYTLNEITK